MWYDMAELPAAAHFLGIAHSTGYPLYLLLGKLFTLIPIGDIGYRANLMSAVFATATVMVVFFIVWDLTQRRGAALIASLTLGVSSTLWANATLAETHALNAFLTALLTYLLLLWHRSGRRVPLFGAFYVLGLAMGNHHLIQFFGPAMVLYWALGSWRAGRHMSWRDLFLFGLVFLGGFCINLYLPIRAAQKPVMMWADASNWSTFLRMITFGQGSQSATHLISFRPADLLIRLRRTPPFPAYEFTVVGLLLALGGVVRLWRGNRPFLIYTLVGNAFTFLFMLSYGIHDIFDYFLPIYVMMSIWLGVGVEALLAQTGSRVRSHRRDHAAGPKHRVVTVLLGLALLGLPAYLVWRDYPVLDRSGDDSSYLYANYLSGRLEGEARILTDFWTWAPLAYHQSLSGWRSDVSLYGALSSLDIDWDEFVPSLMSESEPIYVAAGGPLPPGLVRNAHLYPVGLGVIETVTDVAVPQPRHKDLWVPLGDVYRIHDRPPDLTINSVPASRRMDEVAFGDKLRLLGFGGPTRPQMIGATPKLSYYWTLTEPTSTDYCVRVNLVDSQGSVQQLRGMPIWDHSHTIGSLTPTSTWAPGTIIGERYDTLIPWRLDPGRYAITAWVYAGSEATSPVTTARSAEDGGVALGYLEVLPRTGPLDVRSQGRPRE